MPNIPSNPQRVVATRANIVSTAASLRAKIEQAARRNGRPNEITEAEIAAAAGTPAERAALMQLWRAADHEPHTKARPTRFLTGIVSQLEQNLKDATVKLGGPATVTQAELDLEIAQLKRTVVFFGPEQAKAMVMMARLAGKP